MLLKLHLVLVSLIIILGITVFKTFIRQIYGRKISFAVTYEWNPNRINDNIPPQMNILNTVILILCTFGLVYCLECFVSNWSVASHIKPHIIQQNVT